MRFHRLGRHRSSVCTTGTWRCSTSRRRTRCGARTRPFGCPRRTRRWAPAPSSTAATWSAARGSWSSGCDHATWAFLGGPVIKDGKPVDFGSFLIPRSEYRIDDVWHVVGLKGTGSNTVVVKDVFVPRHRFLSYKSMNDRTAGGLQNNTAPVYKMPWGTVHPTHHLGADRGHGLRRLRRARRAPGQAGARRVRRREVQGRPVRQGSHRRGRQRHRRRLAPADRQRRRRVRTPAWPDKEIPFELRARARRDQVRATGRAIASIDRLFEASGATALSN